MSLLQRLHRRGHIARAPHARDKRKVVITANPTALEDLSNQYAPVIAETDAIAEAFADCEREVVLRYLTRIAVSSERFAEQAVADADADAVIPDDAQRHHAHGVLGDGVRHVPAEPLRLEVERRAEREHVRVASGR